MLKKILWSTLGLSVLFFLFLVWFQATYSMDPVKTKEINSRTNAQKLLIATQGSDYKNDVVKAITTEFENDSIYIKIIDVNLLGEINPDEWNAILVLHTWEVWKPEENAEKFLKKHFDSSKMFVVATSGSGDNRIDGIDGITGASSLDLIDKDSKTIISWLNEVLIITNPTK